jgi:hypothetical protein
MRGEEEAAMERAESKTGRCGDGGGGKWRGMEEWPW